MFFGGFFFFFFLFFVEHLTEIVKVVRVIYCRGGCDVFSRNYYHYTSRILPIQMIHFETAPSCTTSHPALFVCWSPLRCKPPNALQFDEKRKSPHSPMPYQMPNYSLKPLRLCVEKCWEVLTFVKPKQVMIQPALQENQSSW